MKKFSKILSVALLVALVLSLGVANAFAASQYSITVTDGYKGETYTAYKIFDVAYSDSNYAYTISATNEWFSVLTNGVSADASGSYTLSTYGIKLQASSTQGVYNIVNAVEDTNPTTQQMAALAAKLAENVDGKQAAGSGKVDWVEGTDAYGAKASVTIDVTPDEPGYYFVTTTTGSLCALDTSNPVAEVQEKNQQPTIDKKEALEAGTVGSAMTYTDTSVDMSIGDTVYFEIEVTDGKGTDAELTVHDTQSQSLTLNKSSIKVYKGATEVEAGANTFSINTTPTDGCTFEVKFASAYVAGLNPNDKVVVRYNAVLNEQAVIYSNENTNHDDNNNKVHLEYSNQHSQDIEVTQHTFKLQLVKDNGDKELLTGAKFKMYDSEEGTTPIGFIKDGNTYRHLDADENAQTTGYTTEIEAGTPIFSGFGPGTYWFEETDAPQGYNKLTARMSITVTSDGKDNIATFENKTNNTTNTTGTPAAGEIYKEGGLEVVNNSGAQLPSTGGIGTTIFYVVGGVLVLAAIILLVTKKRMSE